MKKPIEGKNIVIIGAGVGGLSAGILLSHLGYRVTVVEKNREPGGLMRSYTRGGIDCPVGVHYVGALGPDEPLGKMFGHLGISVEDLFFRMENEAVTDRYIFDDFTFDLPVGFAAYERNLKQACPQDAAVVDIFMKNLERIATQMKAPSFMVNGGDPFLNMDDFLPMGEWLDAQNASPRLRAILAVPCQLIGVQLSDCPLIFHHMVVGGYLMSAWRLKDGGARMADHFAARFSGLSGTMILHDPVEKILLKDGAASGVRLASGRDLAADAVIAAVHPKAVLAMLDDGALRPSIKDRIVTLAETDGVLAVQASVDAFAHQALGHNIYRLHCDEKGSIEDGIFYQILPGSKARTNLLSVITRSLYGDWRAWEDTKTGRRGADYEERKMRVAGELLKKAEGVFGPLSNPRVLDVFTPLTLRDYMNCPEGACYGVLRSARQLLKLASLNRLPVEGLCLAGQNAMAPGVLGSMLGAFGAVRQIMGDARFIRALGLQL
ncbi:MAG: NAD(P)/FAD-dependent oxidoreductase [Smithellaceae bacterium]